MDKKLSPLQMVAREMAEHSSLTQEQIAESLRGVVTHLHQRARDALDKDIQSQEAIEMARQYQAVSETILFLGSQLIAFEDLDAADSDRIKN